MFVQIEEPFNARMILDIFFCRLWFVFFFFSVCFALGDYSTFSYYWHFDTLVSLPNSLKSLDFKLMMHDIHIRMKRFD